MIVRNIPIPATFLVQEVVAKISRTKYHNNLKAHASTLPSSSGYSARFVLKVKDNKTSPARKAVNGRVSNAANWESHREVLANIFDLYPYAIISTPTTTYHGKKDFEHRYHDTYHINMGSKSNPIPLGSL